MSKSDKTPSQARAFFKGVFWTLFIGMAAHIAYDDIRPMLAPKEAAYYPQQISAKDDAFNAITEEDDRMRAAALDLGDLK